MPVTPPHQLNQHLDQTFHRRLLLCVIFEASVSQLQLFWDLKLMVPRGEGESERDTPDIQLGVQIQLSFTCK